jgi:hypothetical protein
MYILKRLLLGSALFALGSVIFVYLTVIRPSYAQAIGLSAIQDVTPKTFSSGWPLPPALLSESRYAVLGLEGVFLNRRCLHCC